MIGVVIVAHKGLAQAFREALEHIVGRQRQLSVVPVSPDGDVEEYRREISQQAKSVNTGEGVIIVTDMFGGTPSDIAISVMSDIKREASEAKIEVLAGVTLPALIKLSKVRWDDPFETVVHKSEEAGKKYIASAKSALTR